MWSYSLDLRRIKFTDKKVVVNNEETCNNKCLIIF